MALKSPESEDQIKIKVAIRIRPQLNNELKLSTERLIVDPLTNTIK